MSKLKGVLVAAIVFAGTGVLGVPTARADDEKGRGKKPEPPSAAPGQTITIQIDASKLPPEVLKELLKLSKGAEPTKPGVRPGTKPESVKPGTQLVKSISLGEAIAIAEKLTRGTAVKAEREAEDGKVTFEIEVVDSKGAKTEVVLDGSGNVVKSDKKGEEKGKKKGDDEDDKDEKGQKGNNDEKGEKGEKGKGKKKEKDD